MYHFGVPNIVIWLSHVILGAYFLFIGYNLLNKKQIGQVNSLILIVLGVLMALYHGHLWFTHRNIKHTQENH